MKLAVALACVFAAHDRAARGSAQACDTNAGPCWTPPVRARWQYQLEAKGKARAAARRQRLREAAGRGPCHPDVSTCRLWVDPS
jgi:hypothetical protein